MQYYIINPPATQPDGPVELHDLTSHGLCASSMIFREGLADWTRATDVPEVAELLNGTGAHASAPQSQASALTYYLAVNGKHEGPYTASQLREHGVMPTSQVWRQGMDQWAPISSIPELSQAIFGNNSDIYSEHHDNGQMMPDESPANIHPLEEPVYECPSNHLAMAIVAIILFFPTGIGALIKSILVKQRWNERRYGDAVWLSRTSRRLSIISYIMVPVFVILELVIMAAGNAF